MAALYSCLLALLAYEYAKHIGPTLQEAANYLLMFDLLWLNRPIWLLVGPIADGALLALATGFCLYACWPRSAAHDKERRLPSRRCRENIARRHKDTEY